QALSEEYRDRGLRVLALCPGATETAFFDVAGEAASVGRRRTPEQVVATALRALERGQAVVVDGFLNGLLAQLPRLFPRRLAAYVAGQSVRPQPGQRGAGGGEGGAVHGEREARLRTRLGVDSAALRFLSGGGGGASARAVGTRAW